MGTADFIRSLLAALLVCAGYYGGGLIGIRLRFEPGGISGVWLPYGILVAALLLTPIRRWWLYLALLAPTHFHLVLVFQQKPPLPVVLIQYGGGMAQAVLAAAILRPFVGQPPRPNTLSRMTWLIVECLPISCAAWVEGRSIRSVPLSGCAGCVFFSRVERRSRAFLRRAKDSEKSLSSRAHSRASSRTASRSCSRYTGSAIISRANSSAIFSMLARVDSLRT